jgi:hypothetical protein
MFTTPFCRRYLLGSLALVGTVVSAACDDESLVEPPLLMEIALQPVVDTVIQDSATLLWVTVTDGDGRQLAPQGVLWTSSDSGVATVDSTGVVVGRGPGTATVWASVGGVSDSALVTVLPAVWAVRLVPHANHSVQATSWTLVVDGEVGLQAILLAANGDTIVGRDIRWGSSDSSVAALHVSSYYGGHSAAVEGESPGTATITASREGVSASITIAVETVSYVSAAAGYEHRCALSGSGRAFCWGDGEAGQLGDGRRPIDSETPTPVAQHDLAFRSLTVGLLHTCGLTVDGAAYCWGLNAMGQLGAASANEATDVPVAVAGGHNFESLSAGWYHTCGLAVDGTAYCWGWNLEGQLGDGTFVDRPAPVAAAGGMQFDELDADGLNTCGVSTAGPTYCWGPNRYGQLGDGTVGDPSPDPVQVNSPVPLRGVTVGRMFVCGLDATDVPYCWGRNDDGQLGRRAKSIYELDVVPTSLGIFFATIDAGIDAVCGVGIHGTIVPPPPSGGYCWGTSPGRVGPGPDGQLSFVQVSTGALNDYYWRGLSLGVAGDGYLYVWHRANEPERVAGQP